MTVPSSSSSRPSSSASSSASPKKSSSGASAAQNNSSKQHDFPCKIKYRNPLPDIPFDLKLLPFPFSADRHYKYTVSSLEKNRLYEHNASNSTDLGLPVNLLDSDVFEMALKEFFPKESSKKRQDELPVDPEDAVLLAGYVEPSLSKSGLFNDGPVLTGPGKSGKHKIDVPWLRRTQYITQTDRLYGQVNLSNKPKKEQANFLSGLETRKGQLEAVEKTFKSVASTNLRNLKHPTNASLTVAEILPIYPDFEHWSNNLIHGIFTEDPTPHTSQTTSKSDEEASLNQVKLEEALLRRIDVGAEEQQFYGYYTPNDSTATTLSNYRKRLRDNDDEEVELAGKLNYDFVRDYSFTMVDVEDRMIMRLQKGVSAFYQSFNQTLRLKKKRAGRDQTVVDTPNKVEVTYRSFDETEEEIRRNRLNLVLDEREVKEWTSEGRV